jgi:proton-dependent oligopeptide transporter, POT family
MGINIGAFARAAVTGAARRAVGWHWGFGAAGVGMFLGLLVFWLKAAEDVGPSGWTSRAIPDPAVQDAQNRQGEDGLGIGLALIALVVRAGRRDLAESTAGDRPDDCRPRRHSRSPLRLRFAAGGLDGDEKKRVVVIVVLFLFAASSGRRSSRRRRRSTSSRDFTDRNVLGFLIPATWFQSVNSLFIIISPRPSPRSGRPRQARQPRSVEPTKFALGLAFAGVGFALMIQASAERRGGWRHARVAIWWLVGSYFFQTVGELCLSPVGPVVHDQALAAQVRRADDGDLVPRLVGRQPDRAASWADTWIRRSSSRCRGCSRPPRPRCSSPPRCSA